MELENEEDIIALRYYNSHNHDEEPKKRKKRTVTAQDRSSLEPGDGAALQ